MQKKKKYTGVLNKPLILNLVREPIQYSDKTGGLAELLRPTFRAIVDKNDYDQQYRERLRALFEHFDINTSETKTAYAELVLKLAEAHVPGFHQKWFYEQRGTKFVWTRYLDEILWWEVSRRDHEGQSKLQACRAILADRALKKWFGGKAPKTLKARFHKIDKTENLDIANARIRMSELKANGLEIGPVSTFVATMHEEIVELGYDLLDLPLSNKTSDN